jgi:hypothetical protein
VSSFHFNDTYELQPHEKGIEDIVNFPWQHTFPLEDLNSE